MNGNIAVPAVEDQGNGNVWIVCSICRCKARLNTMSGTVTRVKLAHAETCLLSSKETDDRR